MFKKKRSHRTLAVKNYLVFPVFAAVFLIFQSASPQIKGTNDITFVGEYQVLGEIILPDKFRPNSSRDPNDNRKSDRGIRDSSLFVPTVISPTKSYKMIVFRRNGQVMFETTDPNRGWNGFVQGNLATSSTYYYKVEGIFENGQSFSVAGPVQLLKPK